MRPRLLDLFCGAGGAAMGYYDAGFDVVGVDIVEQPRYPFEFVQNDALEVLRWLPGTGVRAIHASPPCQHYSDTRHLHDREHPDLVADVRTMLRSTGLPYVIENVDGAPLDRQASFDRPDSVGVRLCGSSFGLPIWRHRWFESNVPMLGLPCDHASVPEPLDVTGGGPSVQKRTDGVGGRSRKPRTLADARAAMGIDWMARRELNEAIPPAYTMFLGEQLHAALVSA